MVSNKKEKTKVELRQVHRRERLQIQKLKSLLFNHVSNDVWKNAAVVKIC